jgi:DNA replication protein DnaC
MNDCWPEVIEAAKLAQEQAKKADEDHRWKDLCLGEIYWNTDESRPDLNSVAVSIAKNWDPRATLGLGLIGKTGEGKTRCLHIALKKAFDAGKKCFAIRHVAFASLAEEFYSSNERIVEQAHKCKQDAFWCEVLLLDDLGKARSTPARDELLEELVETRTSNNLPILWSANAGGAWLIERFGPDRGPAIARRLAEFSHIPSLPRA